MGIHYDSAEPEHLTGFFAVGPRYRREFSTLSPYQQSKVHAHLEEVGGELTALLVQALDLSILGRPFSAAHPTLLQRLVTGDIDEAIIIGERDSLQLVRKLGLVWVDGVLWHTTLH